jgi:hypothetical protein
VLEKFQFVVIYSNCFDDFEAQLFSLAAALNSMRIA